MSWPADESRAAFYLGLVGVVLATLLLALFLLALTLPTLDRCIGRATLGPRASARESRRKLWAPRPHLGMVNPLSVAPVDGSS